MRLVLERKWRKQTYTIGNLYIDGTWFCNTCEDKDRGLKQTDMLWTIRRKKVANETAIPTGTYTVTMDVVSPKYSKVEWYRRLCGGKMPRILNVPGFDGILIHVGNTALDSSGCILVGRNTKNGMVTSSRDTFSALYAKLKAAHDRGEKITIEIV